MYEATFKVQTNKPQQLAEVFAAEDKELSNHRGNYSVRVENDVVLITAHATDAVAFRAVVSAVSKVLAVYEKVQQNVTRSPNPSHS